MSLITDRIASLATGAQVKWPGPIAVRRPCVSVIVPCYNYARFLPDCLGSILVQSDVDLEVLVIDDASTDASGDIAHDLARRDARIHVIRHRENEGHIATYNHGLREVSGEYVVLLSADDLLTPGSLGRAAALMEAHPGVGFVYGRVINIVGDQTPAPRTRVRSWTIWPGELWIRRRFATSRNVIRTCEVVIRASVQHEIGGYRPELPQLGDLDMWVRAAAVSDVGYIGGADQAYYRLHSGNMHATLHEGRQLSGVLRDLQERALTFELLAEQCATRDGAMAARRALAAEALRYANRAYTFGITDHAIADGLIDFFKVVRAAGPIAADYTAVEELVVFANTVYPGARQLPEWRAVEVSGKAIGRGRLTHNPYHIARDAALRGVGKARRWPWQRLGS